MREQAAAALGVPVDQVIVVGVSDGWDQPTNTTTGARSLSALDSLRVSFEVRTLSPAAAAAVVALAADPATFAQNPEFVNLVAAAAGIPPSELSANVELASIIVRPVVAAWVASNAATTNSTAAIIGGVLGAAVAFTIAALAYVWHVRTTAAAAAAAAPATAAAAPAAPPADATAVSVDATAVEVEVVEAAETGDVPAWK